ncbi:histidine kinase [Bacteroidia bacterium]|nr:histidine kinase [Bacteroidia bacterium]
MWYSPPRRFRSSPNIATAAHQAFHVTLLVHVLFAFMILYSRDTVEAYAPQLFKVGKIHFTPYALIFGIGSTYLFTFLLYVLNFKVMGMNLGHNRLYISDVSKLVIALFVTVLATFLYNYILDVVHYSLYNFEEQNNERPPRNFLLAAWVLFSAQSICYDNKKQQMSIENERLKTENANSHFEALKSQTNPHFLFNSLNTLQSLIDTEPDKAKEYLQRLSSVFRYVMQSKAVTTLREEINFTSDYNSLMLLRYEDSLTFDIQIDERYLDYEILPLSIQILVENAIKHNVLSEEQPLDISIVTEEARVRVSNPIRLKKMPEAGAGIGLSNLAERFRLKWQKEIIISKQDDVFSVTLPLIMKKT